MQNSAPSTDLGETSSGPALSLAQILRAKIHAFGISRTRLWKQIQHFGSWLELDAARQAEQWNQSTLEIMLDPDGGLQSLRVGPRRYPYDAPDQEHLWEFLLSIGIRRVVLDTRLERNQVEDVMALLCSHRRNLAQRSSNPVPPGPVHDLLSATGLHLACTDTAIQGQTLRIAYSYCALPFSRGLRWFESYHKNFRDHRALFHTAPRYAALAGIIVTGPIIIYALISQNWPLFSLSMISNVVLLGIIYLFFLTVGSVEYDNEEQAYQLRRAFSELKVYTDRVQSDIRRARVVQETLLPDPQRMPLPDRIDWASSFIPAEEVGGDYFDLAALDDHRVIILFSDVSGHGMAAAFITAIIKTTFQDGVDHRQPPTIIAQQINSALCRLTPVENFAAVFLALYDTATGALNYVGGGHQPEPWRIPADPDQPIASLSGSRNLLLGIQPDTAIVAADQVLAPGDIILFVSDGIVENRSVDDEFYGTQRFEQFLQTHRPSPAPDLVSAIVQEAAAFSKNAQQNDDRTILAFQLKTP